MKKISLINDNWYSAINYKTGIFAVTAIIIGAREDGVEIAGKEICDKCKDLTFFTMVEQHKYEDPTIFLKIRKQVPEELRNVVPLPNHDIMAKTGDIVLLLEDQEIVTISVIDKSETEPFFDWINNYLDNIQSMKSSMEETLRRIQNN